MSPPTEARRFRLTLHYDGAAFSGWQVQPGKRTVQAELERVLSRLADRPVRTVAAGRTDAGVHATGQVVSVSMPAQWTHASLRRALNALLPSDVWVESAAEAPPEFHARFDAVARAYAYRVGTSREAMSPFRSRWCWPVRDALEPGALVAAAAELVGEHSFRAFAKSGQPERGDRCTVQDARWYEWRGIGYTFQIVANRFLHHMVRYLVGTMVDIARGRRAPGDMARLLAGEPGLETSPPAPARGLFLVRVYYGGEAPVTGARLDSELP